MINQGESFFEKSYFEEQPKLKGLEKFNGTFVEFHTLVGNENKKFEIGTVDLDSGGTQIGYRNTMFCVFELDERGRQPAAFVDVKFDKSGKYPPSCTFQHHQNIATDVFPEDRQSDFVRFKQHIQSGSGFYIDPAYRQDRTAGYQEDKQGYLSQIILAITLTTLEKAGYDKLLLIPDSTALSQKADESKPHFFSDLEFPSMLNADAYASFYTKFSSGYDVFPSEMGFAVTSINTHLSAMQISLLNEAFS